MKQGAIFFRIMFFNKNNLKENSVFLSTLGSTLHPSFMFLFILGFTLYPKENTSVLFVLPETASSITPSSSQQMVSHYYFTLF